MDKNLLVNGEMLLYGDVGDPWGMGDGFTPTDVAGALAEHGPKDITVRINSGGGIAADGMAIHSLLKAHQGKVTMAIDGIAASAASLIAMAGASREIRRGAMMMIHDPSGITMGNVDAHQKAIAKLDKISNNYADVYASTSGKTTEQARSLMKAETWLNADEAVKQGFATKAIDEPPMAMASFDYRIYAHAPRELPMRAKRKAQEIEAATDKVVAPDPGEAAAARMRMRHRQL